MTGNSGGVTRLDLAAGSVKLSVLDDSGFSGRRFAGALLDLFARHDLRSSFDGEMARQTLPIKDWIASNGDGVFCCFRWGVGSPIFATLPKPLFAALFARAFGSDEWNSGPVAPTPLQRRFADRFGKHLADALASGWGDGMVLRPEFAQAAFDSESIEADDTICVAISVPASLAGQSLKISVAFPADRLAAMRQSVAPAVQARTPDDDWRGRIRQRAGHVHLPVRSVLARPEIGAARLLTLRVGDMLPIAFSPSLPVFVGQQLFAHGRMGESNGCAAIRIEQFSKGPLS